MISTLDLEELVLDALGLIETVYIYRNAAPSSPSLPHTSRAILRKVAAPLPRYAETVDYPIMAAPVAQEGECEICAVGRLSDVRSSAHTELPILEAIIKSVLASICALEAHRF